MTNNLPNTLRAKASTKRAQAAIFREVADAVKLTHKKITAATVKHEAAYIRRDTYTPQLFIRYISGHHNDYPRYDSEGFDIDRTPAELADHIRLRADALEKAAEAEERASFTVEQQVAAIHALLIEANTLIDELTPTAREATGLQHNYAVRAK